MAFGTDGRLCRYTRYREAARRIVVWTLLEEWNLRERPEQPEAVWSEGLEWSGKALSERQATLGEGSRSVDAVL